MRGHARTARLLGLLLGIAPLAGCWRSSYLLQQGAGQLRLMHARRRITDVLADPATTPDTRRRLALAARARAFGIEVLGLRGGDNYTRFLDLHGQPVAWNVSAAPRDQIRPIVFHFPVTGAVPYLGFFREEDARRKAAELEAQGLDVYLRPVAGYSTIGLTADPIYSSMLEGSDARIVEVTLHEMLHGTLFLPGQGAWNESLATYVGLRGAALFFALSGGGEEAARRVLAEAREEEARQERFSGWLRPVLAELEALYASPRPREEKLRQREEVFSRAKEAFLREFPPPPGKPPRGLQRTRLNNAVLAALGVYHRGTADHARVFARVGRDLRRMIDVYKRAVERDAPLAWLQRFAAGQVR